MGYALDFGWLEEAVGAIANGAAMTIFLIAVTSAIGTIDAIRICLGSHTAVLLALEPGGLALRARCVASACRRTGGRR